jgi:hypothetical protein
MSARAAIFGSVSPFCTRYVVRPRDGLRVVPSLAALRDGERSTSTSTPLYSNNLTV